MKILVTGSNGFIGRNLVKALANKGYDVTGISRRHVELKDRVAVQAYFKDKQFDAVIHAAVSGGSRLEADSSETLYTNLLMFYNLLSVRDSYKRFIHFGSGAELDRSLQIGPVSAAQDNRFPVDPYGMSKSIIAKIIQQEEDFYNLRIFAVFGEDELDTRFIKANILNYINKRPIEVFQDKYMDFIYITDLVTIVEKYLTELDPPKRANCCYNRATTLLEISEYINSLSDYKVEIKVGTGQGNSYIGNNNLIFNQIGLEQGIKNVYKHLIDANKLSD